MEVIEYWYVGNDRGGNGPLPQVRTLFLPRVPQGDVADVTTIEVEEARWVALKAEAEMSCLRK